MRGENREVEGTRESSGAGRARGGGKKGGR